MEKKELIAHAREEKPLEDVTRVGPFLSLVLYTLWRVTDLAENGPTEVGEVLRTQLLSSFNVRLVKQFLTKHLGTASNDRISPSKFTIGQDFNTKDVIKVCSNVFRDTELHMPTGLDVDDNLTFHANRASILLLGVMNLPFTGFVLWYGRIMKYACHMYKVCGLSLLSRPSLSLAPPSLPHVLLPAPPLP